MLGYSDERDMVIVMSKREQYIVEIIESKVADMIKRTGKVNIDIIEKGFEDGCNKCRMNKDCDRCAIQAKFVEILTIY
jgi:hypothetical protein